MSVLCGTSTGKVYLYSLRTKKLGAIRGEAKKDNSIVGMSWLDAADFDQKGENFNDLVYANQKGELVFSKLDDALKTTGEQVNDQDCIGMQHSGRSCLLAFTPGKLSLATIDFDNGEDIYSVSNTRSIFENQLLPNLTSIQLADQSINLLACLCQEQPPIVNIS